MKHIDSQVRSARTARSGCSGPRSASMLVRDFARPVQRLDRQWSCKQTLQLLNSYPASPCAVVCDADERPLGIVIRERFFSAITGSSVDWRALDSMPIAKMMNKPLIVDADDTITQLRERLLRLPIRPKRQYVIATSSGRLAGVVTLDERLNPVMA